MSQNSLSKLQMVHSVLVQRVKCVSEIEYFTNLVFLNIIINNILFKF